MGSSSPPPGTVDTDALTVEELRLATRNHGMPLEALRYDVTPVGLHYLLTHYDIPEIDPAEWRLTVGGLVDTTLELSLDDLRRRDPVTTTVTMECAGNGRARLRPRALSQPWLHEAIGTAEWTGVALVDLLAEAGLADSAVELVFTGADRGVEGGVEQHYQRSLAIADATEPDVLLAHELNGQPLPPQHGAPLRLVVPGWYGMGNVKWLTTIEAVDAPFDGYQQTTSYRFRDDASDPGRPVRSMLVRSLMVPPGIPDFLTRRRLVATGACELQGRAWSGTAPIATVEVSTDGAGTWHEAELGPPIGDRAWTGWRWTWQAHPGEYELCTRATDRDGQTQPLDHRWNLGGYAVNTVQRVPVTVRTEPGLGSARH